MPVPMTNEQRETAAALLRERAPAVSEIGLLFARHGHELALVGGLIRDVFLGRPPTGDLDMATDATPEEILALVIPWADAVWTVGIAFGTVGARKGSSVFEITTYRSEQYRASSRKPEVQYGHSLAADLSRRDFTVNAMAVRLPGYEFTDPFGGLEALQEKVLRTPGRPQDSFADDPLRILRAARFAAKLGFKIAPDVRAAMTEQAARLEIVSAERIAGELEKLMLTPDPATGIDLLVQTGVADQVLPEVPRLRMEADEHHRHKDVYKHSLTVLRQAIELEPRYGLEGDLVVRLAALLHDIGKPRTRSLLPDGRVAFHLHEVVGAKMAARRLKALRFSNEVIRDVSRLVELHLRFHGYGEGAAGPSRGGSGGRPPRSRLDRCRRAPLCQGRGAAAVPAARADPGRLHHAQPGQGPAAGPRLRRPGAAHRRAVRAGRAGQDQAGARRQRDHAHPGPAAGPAGGPGLRLHARAAHRGGSSWAGSARFRPCCAGRRTRGSSVPPSAPGQA